MENTEQKIDVKKILDRQINKATAELESFLNSEEYKEMEKSYGERRSEVRESANYEFFSSKFFDDVPKSKKEIIEIRDAQLNAIDGEKMTNPLTVRRDELSSAVSELMEKMRAINKEEYEKRILEFKESVQALKQKVGEKMEEYFILLDDLETKHLKPLMEYGMEKSAALKSFEEKAKAEGFESPLRNEYYQIYQLREKFQLLGSLEKRLSSDDIDRREFNEINSEFNRNFN